MKDWNYRAVAEGKEDTMTTEEQAVIDAAIEDVKAGRAYAVAFAAERIKRDEPGDHPYVERGIRAMAEADNCRTTIVLCAAVDVLIAVRARANRGTTP